MLARQVVQNPGYSFEPPLSRKLRVLKGLIPLMEQEYANNRHAIHVPLSRNSVIVAFEEETDDLGVAIEEAKKFFNANASGRANCDCNADDGIPCKHDLALVEKEATK